MSNVFADVQEENRESLRWSLLQGAAGGGEEVDTLHIPLNCQEGKSQPNTTKCKLLSFRMD